MRLLIVEDNKQLCNSMSALLRKSNYVVDCVHTGDDADYVLKTQDYSLVILDLSLPVCSGQEVLARLRGRGSTTPVLILTATDSIRSRVNCLDSGADDYIVKPFDVDEFEARIRARLRRTAEPIAARLEYGQLVLDQSTRQFSLNGESLAFTRREYLVLEALLKRPGSTIVKQALFEKVFGLDDAVNANAIEIYVHRVRKKLEGSDVGIVTFRGLGYALKRVDAPH